ncbi:MAG: nitrilase-related carbon-nitrogen hydrolase [Myxococcota bacterium]
MSTTPTCAPKKTLARSVPPYVWLLLGVITTAGTGMRFGVDLLGWIAVVPWLVHLRVTEGWRSRLALLGALQLGMFLGILTIVTEPIPWVFALMFSVPMAVGAFVAYSTFEVLRRRVGDPKGIVLFGALTVLMEWLSSNMSEMGSWGSMAYTQLGNLPLMQVTSLFGLAGVTLLLALTSAVMAVALDSKSLRTWRTPAAVVASLVLAAHVYGTLRLYTPLPGDLMTVATVTTDLHMGPQGLPPKDTVARETERLFKRTDQAIAQGAQLIIWNEGATAMDAQDEDAFLARARGLAREHHVDIVLAYIVPLDGMKRFENKYAWITAEGDIAQVYHKHHPVPGEGSVRGTKPHTALERPWGRTSGAICYDYDFPAVGRAHAALGVGLVAVPASDWLGIDPLHTRMASVRGIEGGYAVVRSVRWATSGAYDAYGRPRATASYFEGERVMIARVPTGHVATVYNQIGDVLPATMALLVLVLGLSRAVRSMAQNA